MGKENTAAGIIGEQFAPKPDIPPEEWIQRADILLQQAQEVLSIYYRKTMEWAPITLQPGAPMLPLLVGLGMTIDMLHDSATAFMSSKGIQPLDLREEKVRMAREAIADPNCPEHMRETLLHILTDHLGEPTEPEKVEWADVIGGDE